MVHEKALKNMKQKIHIIIYNSEIKDGLLVYETVTKDLNDLWNEVSKHYGAWLTHIDLYMILHDHIKDSLKQKYPINEKDEPSGSLKLILGQEQADTLINNILSFIKSIPRHYDVYFPLPIMNINAKQINLSDKVSFCKYDDSDTIPGGKEDNIVNALVSLKTGIKVGSLYIRIKAYGYIRNSSDDFAFMESLSKLKQIIHVGTILKLFQKVSVAIQRAWYSYGQKPVLNAVIIDTETHAQVAGTVDIPDNVSLYLESIGLTNETTECLLAFKEESAISKYFTKKMAVPMRYIDADDDNKDTQSIKTALEWACDSSIGENETISFIQACIGLEAILGEEAGKEALTKTLADRCAYLLGRNIVERRYFRKEFEKLYDIRSKIIHGRAKRLNINDRNCLHWGTIVLDDIIKKEMGIIKL